MTVKLLDSTGTTVLKTTTTNSSGIYSFTGLLPGNYIVQFVSPSGYVFTPANVGADDTKDSDADVGTGKTGVISLAAGQVNNTNDAGMYRPASLSGYVYDDVNDSGTKDSGEAGIPGVTVTLTGTTGTGQTVTKATTTDSNGSYSFTGLQPGSYKLTETQPAGYSDGKDTVGTVNGTVDGTVTQGTDVLDKIALCCANAGINYNFGEFGIFHGLMATIGFWHNQNGQALIKSFTTTSSGQTLANWLATTFPNIWGKNAPTFNVNATSGTNLTNHSDSDVAAYFLSLFGVSGQKSYAQIMATALSVFTTASSLNTGSSGKSLAAKYGFSVSTGGAGAAAYTVLPAYGAAFGFSTTAATKTTIMNVLLQANKYAVKGVLNNGNQTQINMENTVFDDINNKGDIT